MRPMTKPMAIVAVLVAATATSGCAGFSRAVGADKVAPDEFRVVTQAPLTLPPDYNLRPPRPGEPRPQELEPDQDARAALFGENVGQEASGGERQFIEAAGATAANPDIRDTIDFESQGVVRRGEGFVNRLLAFSGSGDNASDPLNPNDETRRLQEQDSIRRATGGGAVVIQRDRGGFRLPGT